MSQVSSPPDLPPPPPPKSYSPTSRMPISTYSRPEYDAEPRNAGMTGEASRQSAISGEYSTPRSPAIMAFPPDSSDSAPLTHLSQDTSADTLQKPTLAHDPHRLSPVSSNFPRQQMDVPFNSAAHRRVASENTQSRQPSLTLSPVTRNMRHTSASFTEGDSQSDNYQPLQYHHQMIEDRQMRELDNRASRLTVGTQQSDGSEASGGHRLGSTSNVRQSRLGLGASRPNSVLSSTSDFRGRTHSPSLSPAGHLRAVSRGSRSPDTRPISHIDLLNVPYPQPAPSGAENLVNQGLRTVVGNNASLLSTRKTLDMYRANVKKTSDPAIQYEFAIFMISAAQEEGLEGDSGSISAVSQRSQGAIRDDLLKEAKHILQKLCDKSYPFAQYYLADGYASGLFNNGRPDLERSFPLFLAASKHGHAEAMYRTALCYEWGWGCGVNAAKAVQFYQHAASKNHPGAMLRLGRACLTGDMGLGKRYREGIRWLTRGSESADFQYNQAPYDLACLHESGYGPDVFKDESYAAQLYTKAADLGHKDAGFRLGEAYEFGQLNCPRDPALSVHFYTGAAESGHPLAQMALCAWYMVGVDSVLEKDESEAYEWAKRAAEQGLAKAQYTVGYFTEMGIGCRRDPLEANVLYVKAADQGEERAKHRLGAIRAAASGADPVTAPLLKKGKTNSESKGENGSAVKTTNTNTNKSGNGNGTEGEKKKRFGIF